MRSGPQLRPKTDQLRIQGRLDVGGDLRLQPVDELSRIGTVIDVDLNHHLGSHAGSKESHAGAADAGKLLDLLLDGLSQGVCRQHR